MDSIRGVVAVEIAGEKRTLVCDMAAAEVLFHALGAHWLLWLYERFLGKPVKLPDGRNGRHAEPLAPRELAVALYSMLATDRATSGRTESIEDLMRTISPFAFYELQGALTKAVLASLGVPGEVREADAGAVGELPGNERATMHGTGELS